MSTILNNHDYFKIYKKWHQGSGPFRCFVRANNFVSLKHYPDFLLKDVSFEEDENVKKIYFVFEKYDIDKTIFILDIPGTEAIKYAFFLQNYKNIKPILTFNNPLHQFGLVGGEGYISALLGYGELLQAIKPKGYVFILDQERFDDYSVEELRKAFNNQYELNAENLPPIEMLKALGYDGVVNIYSGEVKEDMQSYLNYLTANNFSVVDEKIRFNKCSA